MGNSKIAQGLEKLVNNSANLVGTLQTGVNKILWGSANTQPIQTVKFTPAKTSDTTGSLTYTSNVPPTPTPPKANLVNSGLFNALDALNSVDLCNVITYATSNVPNIKKKKRPDKPWSAAQTALFAAQDAAALAITYIDKYTAYPNAFITSYIESSTNIIAPAIAVANTNAPVQGGTSVQKYNVYFLMQALKDTFTFNSNANTSLLTSEDRAVIQAVPGLGSNINVISDFIGTISKYTDYTQISFEDLQKLQNKITTVRSVCVTIQSLDIQNAVALTGNFLGVDVRSQIQQLGKFVDVTKIIPTLKQIDATLRSFIRIANQIQGILTLGQFLIKLGLLFYKVFKFIITFFGALPIPLIYSTAGIQTKIQDAKEKAKNESDGVMRILKAINALLTVVVVFMRYLLTNANELLIRVDTLLASLEGCEAMKGPTGEDTEVLAQLKQTRSSLGTLKEQLETFIIKHDSKTDPNNAIFGTYQIRVVDEEITDRSVTNKRRRGIALDQSGQIVAQSDLTFATNSSVIIAEVKQKLVSLKLIQPYLANLSSVNLVTISESLDYLDNNDVISDDLNIPESELDSPDNLNENEGLGLQAFVNNLKGGKRLRRRMRAQLAKQNAQVKEQVQKEAQSSKSNISFNGVSAGTDTGTTGGGEDTYAVSVYKIGLIPEKYQIEANSSQEALELIKQRLDPGKQYINWRYTVALA